MSFSTDYFQPESPPLKKLQSSKVSNFRILISFAPYPFTDIERYDSAKVLYECIFEVFMDHDLRRRSTEYWTDINLNTINQATNYNSTEDRQKNPWLRIRYTEPGKTFQIKVTDTTFELSCSELSFANLVSLSAGVYQKILSTLSAAPVADYFRVHERVNSLDYLFNLEFRIEEDIVQLDKQKNHQILQRALNLGDRISSNRAENNAFPSLGLEDIIRLDFNQHGLKSFKGKKYNVKFKTEAPFNEQNSIVFLMAGLAMEEDFGFEFDSAINIEVAFVDFFRDIVIRRVVDNLLCQVKYQIG